MSDIIDDTYKTIFDSAQAIYTEKEANSLP